MPTLIQVHFVQRKPKVVNKIISISNEVCDLDLSQSYGLNLLEHVHTQVAKAKNSSVAM